MGKGFRIFLVSLLGFCVLIGAICIIVPLARSGEPNIPSQFNPVTDNTGDDAASNTDDTNTDTGDASAATEPEPESEFVTKAKETVQTMTLEEQVYQLFMVTPEDLTGVDTATVAGDATKSALEQYPVGGIVYFAKNLENVDQIKTLLSKTQSYAKTPLLLGVDEEGGTVSRLGSRGLGVTELDDMASYDDPQQVHTMGKTLGDELLALGFNLDFAPVADVSTSGSAIGDRAFSSDAEEAASLVGSMVAGMKESGILCTLKHFPGLGGVSADTHDGAASTNATLEQLKEKDFLPFQAGIDAGAPLVMVSHLSAPSVTGDDRPASLSTSIIDGLLRTELGFDGVVVTDALNMEAITDHFTAAEAAVQALEAGADLLLMPEDFQAAVDGVLHAVETGSLPQDTITDSVVRILAMKYEYGIA